MAGNSSTRSHSEEVDKFDAHFPEWWEGREPNEFLSSLFGKDDRLPHMTGEAVAAALEGFSLPLRASTEKLAKAVRRALALYTPTAAMMPDATPGGAEIRDRLIELSDRASALRNEILSLDEATSAPLMRDLEDESFHRFQLALTHLHFLSGTLRNVAEAVPVRRSKWRSTEAARLRVWHARSLAPVFEQAFNRQSTVNDYASGQDNVAQLGPWPEFFSRMIRLAFDEQLSINQVRRALKDARKLHRLAPIHHPPALVPSLDKG